MTGRLHRTTSTVRQSRNGTGRLPLPRWNLAGQRRCRFGFRVIVGLCKLVLILLPEPILTFTPAHFRFQDHPLSPEFRAVQIETQNALAERRECVICFRSNGLEFAKVPHDDFAGAVVILGERSFEQKVVERLVPDMHREALHLRIFAGPFRHGPGAESPAYFQSTPVPKIPGPALLARASASRGSGS